MKIMSLIETAKNILSGPKKPAPRRILDVDDKGNPLYKENIISFILSEKERRSSERVSLERQWTLNANFLMGNQYCDINMYSGDIEQIDAPYDWMERETFNRIAPLIETRIANLKRIKYLMTIKPATDELDDYSKAEVSTCILRNKQRTSDFESQKNTMLLLNEICGTAFFLSWWNTTKGNEYSRETELIVDSDGNEFEKTRAIYEGDLDYGVLTSYEVYPDSLFVPTIEGQRSILIDQVKSVADIYDMFGIEVDGTEVDTFHLTPMAVNGGYGYESVVNTLTHETVKDSQHVYTFFERKSRRRPDGWLTILVGDKDLVYYGPAPYSTIPLTKVVCQEVANQFFGKSKIVDLIPLQRAYNGCQNRINEFIKNIAIGGGWAEEGSVDMEDYAENGRVPGALLTYKQGMSKPENHDNGSLPAEVLKQKYDLQQEMEYVAAVSQLQMTGQAPAGIESGKAIENLRDIDDTRLSLTGDHIRNAIRNMAIIWLEIYKMYANTYRVIKFTGANSIGDVIVWGSEDINSFDIEYDTINELELSEDIQKDRFMQAMQMGLFTDSSGAISQRFKQKALELMKVGNYSEILSTNELQLKAARRENTYFEKGIPAEMTEYDDHDIHIDEHLRYILQVKFKLLERDKPEYANAMKEHIALHKAEQQKEMEALQLAMQPQLNQPEGANQ